MEETTVQRVERLLSYFNYAHLPDYLQEISKPCWELAHRMVAALPMSPELVEGLRKLVEAKDCFVRANIPNRQRQERQ